MESPFLTWWRIRATIPLPLAPCHHKCATWGRHSVFPDINCWGISLKIIVACQTSWWPEWATVKAINCTVRLSITLLSSHFKFYRLETFPVYIPIVFIFFSKSVVFLYRTITWSGDLPCDVVFCVPTIVLGQNDARNVDVSCHKHFVDLTGDQKNAAYCYQR